ncbi:4-phosphoerythronate dehydrogenase [Saccharophagus degradans]|uniref:Erythronate-4-phosphate dehydrogenase n=1 Tax=Saccharophagus degradans (strain 2-40 / ATCC 43961 / DSM 17024) TaxID=203122 RepID=PDXB_SACD2|nr:4-phosphoerythronate dehydrogenase [Saccharophagus degradans]Q21LK8.1 RecName: Full=Erythronate-4-phosphate dehydrogenase [Saccharophagus degradans 2-40]ABD80421.1 D-isomer specific 2-hydroxyacid dehydrogenase, catalytic region [Saccharophagus degradans 2-40]MBU2984370.1 4-phosphoerythronate dehydrogenase [Saccharophagus degradans]
MKIVADENIPFVNELFEPIGEILLRPGREITPADVKNADILLVRSVTPVNAALLEGSKVQFVGTCTIGTDHLDKAYLDERDIAYSSAPGCNAGGVVQYALSAMAVLGLLQDSPSKDFKVAVVGCGNVGSRVYRTLSALGYDCIGVDPFLDTSTIPHLQPFEAIYDCDLICCHTPLTRSGPAPTEHMFNTDVFNHLKSGATLLNAGRGGVIDNRALLQYLNTHNDLTVVLDVWESEPDILVELLDAVALGSTHIAGYSYEGRINGSLMIHRALIDYLLAHGEHPEDTRRAIEAYVAKDKETINVTSFADAVLATYDVRDDDALLRQAVQGLPASFDMLRKQYRKRREFSHYQIEAAPPKLMPLLQSLGYGVVAK